MGQFTLCATSVDVSSRSHQGVPLEVEVIFSLHGGNRFERYDFTEAVTRRGPITFKTSQGWTDRVGLSGKSDDLRTLHVIADPPVRSSGYTLEIGNPYGEPAKFILDLGR